MNNWRPGESVASGPQVLRDCRRIVGDSYVAFDDGASEADSAPFRSARLAPHLPQGARPPDSNGVENANEVSNVSTW